MVKTTYIFLDEGGNFDFSLKGTQYFSLTSLLLTRPFFLNEKLENLKFDLIETGKNIEYFHASEDKQFIRNSFYDCLRNNTTEITIDSLIIDKRKTNPAIREEAKFYPKMLGYLLKFVVSKINLTETNKIIIITDELPVNKKKKAIEKAIKETLANLLPNNCEYDIFHHASKSTYCLQIVDYCNWSILRKWERGDLRSYDLIKDWTRSEFNIFEKGNIFYY